MCFDSIIIFNSLLTYSCLGHADTTHYVPIPCSLSLQYIFIHTYISFCAN